ncbi:hypothetical protein, partial [Nocardia brasiliensis]|uniref:hypothetical protein n=1 Tax=Nocardia brasiliensis TaxID=37326 RepID=UPI00245451C3
PATGTPFLPPAGRVTFNKHSAPRSPGRGDGFGAAAAELGDYNRLSIEHNDVHPGNAFAGTGLLFDWADAVITHPFLSHRILRTTHRAEYFAHWRRGGPISRTEIALAERLAPLIALHPWRTIDVSAPPFARTVEALLDELRTSFR